LFNGNVEEYYTEKYGKKNSLIPEQYVSQNNTLFKLILEV